MLLDVLQDFLPSYLLARLFVAAFLGILFLQSGLDKVFNWKGNLDWLTGHFSKTFLKDQVPLLLAVVTVVEILAGAFSALGIIELLIWKKANLALLGAESAALALVMLFFGQRIAQDYEGAANLVGYFLLSIVGIWLFAAA